MCEWGNCATLGVGFQEGIVELLDTRMMLPVRMVETPEPVHISSVARDQCSFVVASRNDIVCYDACTARSVMRFKMNHGLITEYDGNIVALDTNGVYHIDCKYFTNSVMLFDENQSTPMTVSEHGTYTLEMPKVSGNNLHQHGSAVACLAHSGRTFMSGDATGFLNFWSVGP